MKFQQILSVAILSLVVTFFSGGGNTLIAEEANEQKTKTIENDKKAAIKNIDVAIEKSDDTTVRKLLRAMKHCIENDDKKLDLSEHNISALPAEIGLCQNLSSLDISGNRIQNLQPEILKLKNLTELSLWNNRFTTFPTGLEKLPKLRVLYLSYNKIEELPTSIAKLTSLKELDLRANHFKKIPTQIGKLSKLISLELSKNHFTKLPPSIGNLSNLEELNLSGVPITDSELKHLQKLSLLRKLNLKDTKATKPGIQSLIRKIPKCGVIYQLDLFDAIFYKD